MENEKKPSRLGVRLSAIVLAVLLVVCMAVPAFAATGSLDGYPPIPEERTWVLVNDILYAMSPGDSIRGSGSSWHFYSSTGGQINGTITYKYQSGEWVRNNYAMPTMNLSSYDGTTVPSVIKWSNMDVELYPDRIVFVDPPPDPLESFGSSLTVVLDWVGSVVSAVVSGPMSGLLILLAVPVAITLLLVAFIVIRRIIWGA